VENDTIVITGGLGFIGSRFIHAVYENTKLKIINIDKETYAADHTRLSERMRQDIKRYRFMKEDICIDFNKLPDLEQDALLKAKYVVNFAAETHVDNSITNGRPFVKTNVEGVLNLLEYFKHAKKLKKFIQISTDEVYGDMYDLQGRQSSDESFKLRPSSYYSATKASAELLVQAAARTFDVPYLITRTCNNFGPNQNPEKFIPKVFKAIKGDLEIPIYGDGLQSREWMHVDDNCQTILELMFSSAENEEYNIGSGFHYKNIEIVKYIAKQLGMELKTVHVEDRLGHDRVYRLNNKKTEEFLGEKVYQTLEGFLKDEISRTKDFSNRG